MCDNTAQPIGSKPQRCLNLISAVMSPKVINLIVIIEVYCFFLLVFTMMLGCREPAESDQETPRYHYQIVSTYPHNTQYFTQGLAFKTSGELLESAGGYGRSVLECRSLLSSESLYSRALPSELFAEGVSQIGTVVMQLTWQARQALIYHAENFNFLGSLSFQSQGWGLTHGPLGTVYSDGSSELRWITHPALKQAQAEHDPNRLDWQGSLEVVRIQSIRESGRLIAQLNELEWVGSLLFANLWQSNDLVVIDPNLGKVIARIDLSGLLSSEDQPEDFDPLHHVLNGIAWLPYRERIPKEKNVVLLTSQYGRLFVTGKHWPLIYEIKLVPVSSSTKP